jgi:hypothetical protein
MAEGDGLGLRKERRSIAAPPAFWRLIAFPVPGLTQPPGGIGGNTLRVPAIESEGIIPVVAIEEWRADAAQLVMKVTAHAIAGEAAHVAPCKAAADMVSTSAIAAEATSTMPTEAAAEASTTMAATATASAAAASKRIIGDARASERQSGDEGHNLLQNELLHHDCLSVRYSGHGKPSPVRRCDLGGPLPDGLLYLATTRLELSDRGTARQFARPLRSTTDRGAN